MKKLYMIVCLVVSAGCRPCAEREVEESHDEVVAQRLTVEWKRVMEDELDTATFESAWGALVESIEDNGCATLEVAEAFPINKVQTFRVRKADMDEMRAEMERAYKEEASAAKAVIDSGKEGA